MRVLFKKDLRMNSMAITFTTKHKISEQQKTSRLDLQKRLLGWMTAKNNVKNVRVFSDEKVFTVDPVLNRRDDRYMSDRKAEDVEPGIKYREIIGK